MLRNTCETLVPHVLAAARLGERLEVTVPWQLGAAAVLPLEGGEMWAATLLQHSQNPDYFL